MSDPIGYLGGGKYKPYIDQLVKIAEDKRKPMEARLEQTELQKDVLSENRRDVAVLQDTIRKLFGLENVFNQSSATSSNPDAVTAEAKRGAKPANLTLDIQQIAAADRFYSKELDTDHKIDAGTYDFFVGETKVSLSFEGGTITDFAEALSKVSPENFKASVVKSSQGKETLLIEGQKTGAQHKINFDGLAKKMAFDIGLITDEVAFNYLVKSDNAGLKPESVFDPKNELRLNPGRYTDVSLQSEAPLKLQKGAYLSFEYKKTESGDAPSVIYPAPVPLISKQQALREGSLMADVDNGLAHLPRMLEQPNLYLVIDGALTPLKTLELQAEYGSVKINLDEYSGDVEGIVLRNESGMEDVLIRNMEFFTPNELDFVPINAASRAQDAEFTLDGVEVKRPDNKIEDLNPEVSLYLHGKSQGPVTIAVKPDIDEAEEAIRNFIMAYNSYVSKINIVTTHKENTAVIEEITFQSDEEKEAAEKKLGLYQGDSQLNQLKSTMFTMMISPYFTGEAREAKMVFGDMGISTNNQGVAGIGARRGYFEIDDKKLRGKLEGNWEDVKNFFASHTGATIIADDGLAVKMSDYLKPFAANDGLFSNRITILDNRIESQEKEIDDFNEKLEDQKKKWQGDFAKVQSAEAELERLQKQMDSTFSDRRR